jgi:hypothetical protein
MKYGVRPDEIEELFRREAENVPMWSIDNLPKRLAYEIGSDWAYYHGPEFLACMLRFSKRHVVFGKTP